MRDSSVLLCTCLSVLLCVVCCVLGQQQQLRMVVQLNRHGDRAPNKLAPLWLNQTSDWPLGLGELTAQGMWQLYQLGLQRQSRYMQQLGFLNPTYDSTQLYVRSTSVNRCLMSANSELYGMYPLGTGPINQVNANQTLPHRMQFVPVESFPVEVDILLRPNDNCPNFPVTVQKRVVTSTVWRQKESENEAFLQKIANIFGYPSLSLFQSSEIRDVVLCYYDHKLPLPPQLTDSMRLKLYELGAFKNYHENASPHVLPMTAGPFLQQLQTLFTHASQGEQQYKFYLYSAHDTTLLPPAVALEAIPQGYTPAYADHLDVELYAVETKDPKHPDFAVRVLYNNDPVNMDYCPSSSSMCPLDEFLKHLDSRIPSNWDQLCGISTSTSTSDWNSLTISLLVAAAFAVLTVIVVSISFGVYVRKHRGQAAEYQALLDGKSTSIQQPHQQHLPTQYTNYC